jgi:hypothetical protein
MCNVLGSLSLQHCAGSAYRCRDVDVQDLDSSFGTPYFLVLVHTKTGLIVMIGIQAQREVFPLFRSSSWRRTR